MEEENKVFGGCRQFWSEETVLEALIGLIDLGKGLYLHMISIADRTYLQIKLTNLHVNFSTK